ncbi:uncharacterized protein LOC111781910 [Cucurbita pepo subsp. pepo]|uniref:uncharacterized protein LOC111781910 n=1 Tax=Cucurbita pepo subsp. pepo TaxID=3664 RepID=UPI000C9D83D7|nr:uncharacterized protein LOC111781910 [Cucurbita pepo subsp. pepo]
MGNCLMVQQNPIRIMKPDGKILEYKSPIRVFQVLSDFSGHAISDDAVPVTHHLQQTTKLLSGHLYFLIPTAGPEAGEKRGKKAVRFADPEKETGGGEGKVMRIKVVMTKKELEEMVERGGITADQMISKIKTGSGEISCRELEEEEHDDDEELHKWRPSLQSIPESEVAC